MPTAVSRRPILQRHHENLVKGAVHGETGRYSLRVVEEQLRGGKTQTHLFDAMTGKRINIDWRALSRTPSVRREVAARIVELGNAKKAQASHTAVIRSAITELAFFEKHYKAIAATQTLRAAANEAEKTSEIQLPMFNSLFPRAKELPQTQKAIDLLSQHISIPDTSQSLRAVRIGALDPRVLVKNLGIKEGVAKYEHRDGHIVYFPLTPQAMQKIASERVRAIREAKAALEKELASKDEKAEQETVRELSLLRNAGRTGRVLSPLQIARLYLYYKERGT